MNTAFFYSLALFLHVTGAFGLIAAMTIEALGLRALRQAVRPEDALASLRGMQLVRPIGAASAATILITGLYMTATAWGWRSWIVTALASLLLIALIGALGGGLLLARLGQALGRARAGAIPEDLRRRIHGPALVTSLRTRFALTLGVLFLMTVKPTGLAPLAAIAVAAVLGVAAGQIPPRRTGNELSTESR